MMTRNSFGAVKGFLGLKRIAMIGVSRNDKDFSRTLFRDLAANGYDVVPVNPAAGEIEGRRCYPGISAVDPPVQGALLMTRAIHSADVVRECATAGVDRVWLYRAGAGPGAVSEEAVTAGRELGLHMVIGECPYMFLQNVSWFHHVHGWLKRLTGTYPN
jgi:predicted CoA-binding protein